MKIAIVNDLRLAVETLRRAVAFIPEATLAWTAENGAEAVERAVTSPVDIVLMDMVMPVMDGVEATRQIMRRRPCPILVVTATIEGNATKVFDALGAGALDAVVTPTLAPDGTLRGAEVLTRKIRSVALLSVARRGPAVEAAVPPLPRVIGSPGGAAHGARPGAALPIVAIGSSTGGPDALVALLKALPRPVPWAVAIVQHVDPLFAGGLADWLGRESGQPVGVALPGAELAPGRVLLASTSDHMILDSALRLRYREAPLELAFRPSVDVFFDSLAAAAVAPGTAVVLTGMGRDGALGMRRLRAAGWHTIAQDRETSVVWGMPGACAELGAAVEVLPVAAIGAAVGRSMQRFALGGTTR